MTLFEAGPAVILHALPALAAFALGAVQLALTKGGTRHRLLGWAWVGLMALVSASSFFIHTICSFGGFSAIHLLSILTLLSLPFAVLHARRGRHEAHGKSMKLLFFLALVLAGAFTFTPGRIMYDMVTGQATALGPCD